MVCQLRFPEHVGAESFVARAYIVSSKIINYNLWSHDHNLLPPAEEVEVSRPSQYVTPGLI